MFGCIVEKGTQALTLKNGEIISHSWNTTQRLVFTEFEVVADPLHRLYHTETLEQLAPNTRKVLSLYEKAGFYGFALPGKKSSEWHILITDQIKTELEA